jgi:hypothetical protein
MKKVLTSMIMATVASFALTVGEIPNSVSLSEENGGLVDGTAWHSSMIKDKLYVLFYVDPDKKEDNDPFIDALHNKNYDQTKYGSIAIINLKATWLPNFAIERKLAQKQEEFPNTIYAKDKTKHLVKEWELADDSANVVVFNKEGKVLYTHTGEMTSPDIEHVFEIIEREIATY